MKVTFLVGNGFDMALGVDTSYGAFYKWYLEQESPNRYVQDLKNSVRKYLDGNGENWSDFELGLGQYTKQFSVDEIQGFFECYNDATNNIIRFLIDCSSFVDTRLIPRDDLIRLLNGLVNFYSALPSGEAQQIQKAIGNKMEFDFISFNYTNLFNEVIKASVDLINRKEVYFEAQFKPQFNSNILNLHGTSTYLPILGVSEEYQIANTELLKIREFKEIMIKSQCVNAIGEAWYDIGMNLIDASDVICIFGMSVGASDSVWWTKIMNHLINNVNSHVIVFWYSKSSSCNTSMFEHITEKRRIKDIFFEYSELSEEQMQEIENRIHIIFNTKKIFNLTVPKKSPQNIDGTKHQPA